MELKKVFEPGKIGNLELKNRLVVSAMSSHMGNPDGTPNETAGVSSSRRISASRPTPAATQSSARSGTTIRCQRGPRPSARCTPPAV